MPRVVFKPFQVAAKIHLPYFVCPRCGTSGVGSIHQHYSTFCPRLKYYPYAERSSESESEDESESSSDDYSSNSESDHDESDHDSKEQWEDWNRSELLSELSRLDNIQKIENQDGPKLN